MSRHSPDPPKRLESVQAEAWELLTRGADDPASAFHWPALATIGLDGRPRLRTVVLRAVEVGSRRLVVHTDARSDKVREIRRHPAVALHAYDPGGRIQLRLGGNAVLKQDGPDVKVAWRGLSGTSRTGYAAMPGPGQPIATDLAYDLPEDEAAIAAGRSHFVLVEITVWTLEYLHLDGVGHRRARFVWAADGTAATWLAP